MYICTRMKFDDYRLSKEVKKNLRDMDFRRPTDIQYKCIPPIQRGEDLLAIAQTGTGKTAAFAIPVIDKLQQIKYKSKNNNSVIRSITGIANAAVFPVPVCAIANKSSPR